MTGLIHEPLLVPTERETPSAKQVLEEGLRRVQAGWTRGAFTQESPDGRLYCAVGAIESQYAPFGPQQEAFRLLYDQLPNVHRFHGLNTDIRREIWSFNDTIGVPFQKHRVIRLFKKAIRQATKD